MLRVLRDYPTVDWYFKASFDKANRTSGDSERGMGLSEAKYLFEYLRKHYAIKIVTDVHETWQVREIAPYVDMLQIPAFLCRQTDLIEEARISGLPLNIKRGQFLSPSETEQAYLKAAEKVRDPVTGETFDAPVYMCERGTTFGYGRLVNDFAGLHEICNRVPLIYDASHSAMRPGAEGTHSGGYRAAIGALTRAAAATGMFTGYFCEFHPYPPNAISDAKTQMHLKHFEFWLDALVDIHEVWHG